MLLLTGAVCTPASAQNGQVVGNLADALAGVDRDAAHREGQQQRADLELARANAELARATAELARTEEENRRTDERFRTALASHWERAGLSPDEARSVAAAWQWTGQEDAIMDSVSRNGLEATARDIGTAYRAFNYLLANQLLLAYLVVRSEVSAAKTAQPTP
ncbi:MAG TPA: hypothetical protein VMU03_02250 [Gammaproteobacteria bacterium]|nr:hypothetical protein [Gammaproteobacteria bacterium]